MQTPSDFDYKPRRKTSMAAMADTQQNTEYDANSTGFTNTSHMNKTAKSTKNNINANSDDKEEDWFFRSVNRTDRDKVLDVKEDFKKLRPHFYNNN